MKIIYTIAISVSLASCNEPATTVGKNSNANALNFKSPAAPVEDTVTKYLAGTDKEPEMVWIPYSPNKGFYLSKSTIQTDKWHMFMDNNRVAGEDYMCYADIREYIRLLNAATGKNYRLPTPREWDYAAKLSQPLKKLNGNNKNPEAGFTSRNEGNDVQQSETPHIIIGSQRYKPEINGMDENTQGEWTNEWYTVKNEGTKIVDKSKDEIEWPVTKPKQYGKSKFDSTERYFITFRVVLDK